MPKRKCKHQPITSQARKGREAFVYCERCGEVLITWDTLAQARGMQ